MLWVTRKKQNFPPVLLALMSLLFAVIYMHYRPRSGWLGIGQVWTLLWTETKSTSIKAQKRTSSISKQLWLIRDLLPYIAKPELFLVGQMVEIPERSILPTQGGGGASLPWFFFSSWIFVPRSTIWTGMEQAILKIIKKIEQWKYILYHSNNNIQMMLYNAQMTT